jgi:hypothetical protein
MTTKVVVLGAGCSVKYGFPLAAGFVPRLKTFSATLPSTAAKLKACVDETVALMGSSKAQTLDELTLQIRNGVLDDPKHSSSQAYALQLQRILRAKVATAALFLEIEQTAQAQALESYQRLILTMFPGGGGWEQSSRTTEFRLLSFNYDRLFEMALLRRFRIDIQTQLLYGNFILNSGLNDLHGGSMSFADARFCFLKLHGSIGMRIREERLGPCYYPYLDGETPGQSIAIDDQRFFAHAPPLNPYDKDPEPLIVFPFEKDFVRGGSENKLAFRSYISAVWQKAEEIVASADDIRFIGYSFHPMDQSSVLQLLRKASQCKRIVVQNRPGEAEQICKRLAVDFPDITIPLIPHGVEF